MGQTQAPPCTKCPMCHVHDTNGDVCQKEKETAKKEEISEAEEDKSVTTSTCETEKENTKRQQQIRRPETSTE